MATALDVYILLFLRASGLIFSSPIFGRRNIPNIAKIGLSGALAFLFLTSVPDTPPIYYDNIITFIMLCIMELMFGVVFGYITNLFITLVFTAGQLMDMQSGFGMVSVFDVQSNLSIPITGNLLNIAILLVFFLVDGHLKLIHILYTTVLRIPVGTVQIMPNIALVATQLFAETFILAVNVAMPIIFSGLLLEATMGIIVKSVPQLNVFSVGLPLKVLGGLVILMVIVPVFVDFTDVIFNSMFAGLEQMFAAMMSS